MWTELEMIEYLQANLKKTRFEHSLSVRDTAVKLAQLYNEDVKKASIAGLIHDCAKDMNTELLIQMVESGGHEIDEISKRNPALLHGLASAIIAEEKMGVTDRDILNSISFHTTGRRAMSTLEKIIYLADYIEPLRNFEGVEELRKSSWESLDKGLLLAFNNTIKYVIFRGELLHKNTIEARNYLMNEGL